MLHKALSRGGGHSNPLIKHLCTKFGFAPVKIIEQEKTLKRVQGYTVSQVCHAELVSTSSGAAHSQKPVKRGFTLAEVLITLAIVGIIAAMTIPNLISKNQKRETVTRMKDAYSTIANALKMAEEEYGNGFSFTDGSSGWSRARSAQVFETYLQPFLKINFKYKDAQCNELTKSYPQGGETPFQSTNSACYSLMNGSALLFWAGRDSGDLNDAVTIVIVTNPNKKKKIIGKDAFSFAIVPNENGWYLGTEINFREPNATRESLKTLCGTNAGRIHIGSSTTSPSSACTELIRRDGWAIMDDYPIKF